jgi:hypothetical protein
VLGRAALNAVVLAVRIRCADHHKNPQCLQGVLSFELATVRNQQQISRARGYSQLDAVDFIGRVIASTSTPSGSRDYRTPAPLPMSTAACERPSSNAVFTSRKSSNPTRSEYHASGHESHPVAIAGITKKNSGPSFTTRRKSFWRNRNSPLNRSNTGKPWKAGQRQRWKNSGNASPMRTTGRTQRWPIVDGKRKIKNAVDYIKSPRNQVVTQFEFYALHSCSSPDLERKFDMFA